MARSKTQKPLTEDPPEADSSEEVTGSSSSGEEGEEPEEEVSNTGSSSGEEEEEETPSTPVPPPSFKKIPLSAAATKRPLSEDDFDDDTSDDSPLHTLKSASKPAIETPSKPRSKSTVAAEKRPSETELKTSSKKPRKEKLVSGAAPAAAASPVVHEEASKKLFQRVFSEGDEIEILKGMIEYRAKRGADPMVEIDDFYGFVKKSVHVDVNKGQIVDKVRRLKKKFFNAKKKKLNNPHEIHAFELSKKIWDINGGDDVMEDDKINNVTIAEYNNNHNNNVGSKPNSKPRVLKLKTKVGVGVGGGGGGGGISSGNGVVVMEDNEGEKGGGKVSDIVEKDVEFEVGEAVAWEKLRKRGLTMMGAKARAEIDEMWEKVAMKQAEAKIMRSEVEREETRRIMEALRSGKN
ncbi:hypothetical protein SOVF_091830 [Spinacia oleracea]|uniref:Probable transcription factor At1g61730 n=1 Tax=Spinacia oleracea TaxID=3562 RepID=A0A9R0IS29_SPIOL|nr:probable transcription factor At1g61730 [Spinacia oleracea]KNA16147.1 hypothetical protein SOVF_091830 [Spinacia oleracea]